MAQKMIAVLFLVAMLLGLTACAQSDNLIEKNLWNIATVQSIENNGAIIACAPNTAASDAALIDLSLSAQNGKLTLEDRTNTATYEGTYAIADSDAQSTIYAVTLNGNDGTAVLSDTKYADGTAHATLILTVGNDTLTFYGKD